MSDLIARNLLPVGREALDLFPVLSIQGARQVGKSTLARMLVEDRPHRHLTLDDNETLQAARDDPRGFVEQFPGQTLVVDEIQRWPALLLAIKAAVDRDRQPGRYVVTGSSNLLALAATPDSLAGRAVTLNLQGLSQGEVAGRKEDFAAWLRSAPPSPQGFTTEWRRADYVEALARGGYPEAVRLAERGRRMWLDSYIERILGRDLTELSGRLNDSRVKDLLRLVAANQGGELVKARLARQLAVAPTTVDTYWRALRTLYLVQEIEPWTANLTQRQVGRRKAQVSDPALALRLTGLRPRTLQEMTQAEHLGGLIEAWAVGELIKQRAWSEEDFNLYHFRDRNGSEVDIVIEYADGKVFLIEVKAAQSYNHSQTKGIRRLTAELGDRCLGGAVLGLSEQGYRLGDKLYGLPLSILWQAGAEG